MKPCLSPNIFFYITKKLHTRTYKDRVHLKCGEKKKTDLIHDVERVWQELLYANVPPFYRHADDGGTTSKNLFRELAKKTKSHICMSLPGGRALMASAECC